MSLTGATHDATVGGVPSAMTVGPVLAKLELRDRVQIVIYAYDQGLVAPGA